MVRGGILYKRYDVKQGKTPPPGFEPAQDYDPITGHMPGWIQVEPANPADKWHAEAPLAGLPDGTYELCGPKVQGNPEGFPTHTLVRHGAHPLPSAPRAFAALREYFAVAGVEGVVWHHPDGRMVKIKAKDFGIRRGRR